MSLPILGRVLFFLLKIFPTFLIQRFQKNFHYSLHQILIHHTELSSIATPGFSSPVFPNRISFIGKSFLFDYSTCMMVSISSHVIPSVYTKTPSGCCLNFRALLSLNKTTFLTFCCTPGIKI